MAGIFTKSKRPKLPGAYFNFEPEVAPAIPPVPGVAVAIPFTHDWGPAEQTVRLSSFGEFQSIFGVSDDTEGYRAVKQAFIGEGGDLGGGAGEVVAFRAIGTSAAKATKVLQNTAPANAITLTARYEGSKGNDLRVTVQDYAGDSAQTELILLDGTKVLEIYRFADANINDLAAQINASSDWVTAGTVTSGTALGLVSAQALTGGDDGTTLAAGDYTAWMNSLDIELFAVALLYGVGATDGTSTAIRLAFANWVKTQNNLGKRFFGVVGGAAGEALSAASTRSGVMASWNILNVGVGTITDETLGPDRTAIDLSTSEFAARVAGALAQRGEYRSLTHARFPGVSIKVGPTLAEIESCFAAGIVALGKDSHSTAPTHVKVGVTTWTSTLADADGEHPYLIYRQPKYVRTIHGIETDLTQWAEEFIIGQRPVNQSTREAVVGEVKARLTERQTLGAVQPGWAVAIDQDPPPTDDDEFIALTISASFARSLEQVYFTVTVG